MSVEIRKADSVMMKLIVKAVKKKYNTIEFGGMDMEGLNNARNILGGEKKKFGGVPVEVSNPLHGKNSDTIIYIHGGAFVFGIFPHHRKYAEALASKTGCNVVMVDYSLSPENKYPKALDECERVYKYVKRRTPNGKIILAGDSAGGGMCLSLTMRLHSKGIDKPICLILHSPFTDLSGALDRTVNQSVNDDFIIKKGLKGSVNKSYAGSADPSSCDISPFTGDYSILPPVFVTCSSTETLYADSLDLNERLEKCGGSVKMIVFEGGFHTCGTLGDMTIETKSVTNEIAEFVNKIRRK